MPGERVDLSGRTAVVTGAASGIGTACAVRLAAAGAKLVVVDVDASGAEHVAARVGGRAAVVDLSELDAVDGLGLECDILVNNAGMQHVARIEDFDPNRFSLMLRLMLEAPFGLVRQALPHMYAAGWGRIVNISSVHGLRASPFKAAYVAAKHGLEGLSKAIALEGAAPGLLGPHAAHLPRGVRPVVRRRPVGRYAVLRQRYAELRRGLQLLLTPGVGPSSGGAGVAEWQSPNHSSPCTGR